MNSSKANDVEILKGHISTDHVHIFVSVPPHLSVSQLAQSMKGKTSRKMLMEYKSLSRAFWGRHMWARGYFAVSSGNVTDEVIMKYIEQQGLEPPDAEFKIDEELQSACGRYPNLPPLGGSSLVKDRL
jgi:putative transposase